MLQFHFFRRGWLTFWKNSTTTQRAGDPLADELGYDRCRASAIRWSHVPLATADDRWRQWESMLSPKRFAREHLHDYRLKHKYIKKLFKKGSLALTNERIRRSCWGVSFGGRLGRRLRIRAPRPFLFSLATNDRRPHDSREVGVRFPPVDYPRGTPREPGTVGLHAQQNFGLQSCRHAVARPARCCCLSVPASAPSVWRHREGSSAGPPSARPSRTAGRP